MYLYLCENCIQLPNIENLGIYDNAKMLEISTKTLICEKCGRNTNLLFYPRKFEDD